MNVEYEDIDDDGNPLEKPYQMPAWKKMQGVKRQDLLEQFFSICSGGQRKSFASPRERKDWNKFVHKLETGVISEEWAKECVRAAEYMNKDRVKWNFQTLLTRALDPDKRKDWEAKHRIQTMDMQYGKKVQEEVNLGRPTEED